MLINKQNANHIHTKELHLHDYVFVSFEFLRTQKKIVLGLKRIMPNGFIQYSKIEFLNVLGFLSTSCDYWGASERVFDFEYIEDYESVLLPNLKESWNDPTFKYPFDDSMELLFTFVSGDHLRIVCKELQFYPSV